MFPLLTNEIITLSNDYILNEFIYKIYIINFLINNIQFYRIISC
jgi:hypothetical protein